jgi:hypothetical protein
MVENKLIFDLILMEADRVQSYRYRSMDLYYKDPYGDMVPIGEAYKEGIEELINGIFKKRKMRYFITFTEALELQDELRPSAHRLIRFFCRHMTYGNIIKNYGIRDIQTATGINTNYILKGVAELCKHDMIRFEVNKGRRTYMVNPIFFYKGTMKKLFACVRRYDEMPKRGENLKPVEQLKDTIF